MDSRDDHFGFRDFALDFDAFSWSDFRLWIPSFGFWALRCALDFHDSALDSRWRRREKLEEMLSQSIFGISDGESGIPTGISDHIIRLSLSFC